MCVSIPMFVLPAMIFPFVFALAIFRLYQIPRRLLAGELQVPAQHRVLLSVGSGMAYMVLLGYTLALSAMLIHAIFLAEDRLSTYLSVLAYTLAYPVVYVAAAWVFYYGLKSVPQAKGATTAPS